MLKRSPIPLYYQIKTRLLEAIEGGQYRVGEQIPSERELTARYGVSRMTARQALVELESQGYLQRVQGKGTFVSIPKLDQPLLALTSFTEDMRRRGMEPGSQLIAADEIAAGKRVGQALGLGDTEVVFRVERLRLANGQPMAVETAHVPAVLCPGLLQTDFSAQSLYAVLRERYGHQPVKARQSLEAVPVGSREAKLLGLWEGAPVLLMERVARDAAGVPIEYVRSLYRGDRYRFTTELVRHDRDEG